MGKQNVWRVVLDSQPPSLSKLSLTGMKLLLLAAFLWGVTNPLLKRYSAGMQSGSSAKDDWFHLIHRPKYLVSQVANLLGSVFFFLGLRDVDVSVGSIVANSLAFVITLLVSLLVLREGRLQMRTSCGCVLVLLGTALCTLSQTNH